MATAGWEVLVAVRMGAEAGTVHVAFAFPLPPCLEKQLPPWEYFHSFSLPMRWGLHSGTTGLKECKERGDSCQETPGIAAKTSLPTQEKDFLQTQLKIAPALQSAGQNEWVSPKYPSWL